MTELRNRWGNLMTDVGEGFCPECERGGGSHYEKCPFAAGHWGTWDGHIYEYRADEPWKVRHEVHGMARGAGLSHEDATDIAETLTAGVHLVRPSTARCAIYRRMVTRGIA